MTQTEYRRFIELLDCVLMPLIPHFKQEEQQVLNDGLYYIRDIKVEEHRNDSSSH